MFDEELERIRSFCKVNESDKSSDKRIKNLMLLRLKKVDYLQALYNSLDSGDLIKTEFPDHIKSMTQFCKWNDVAIGVEGFGKTAFVQSKITNGKILETERKRLCVITTKLIEGLKNIKSGTISATESVKRLRGDKQRLTQGNANLVSQLLGLKNENNSLTVRLNSYAMQIEKLEEKFKTQSAKVFTIGGGSEK